MVQLNERENQVAEAETYELKQARYSSKWYISKNLFFQKPTIFYLVLTNTKSVSTQSTTTWHH